MIPQLNVAVIREELEAIRNRRLAVFLKKDGQPAPADGEAPLDPELAPEAVDTELARKAVEAESEAIAPPLRAEPPKDPEPAAGPDERVKRA
jgi:hypothetical protein